MKILLVTFLCFPLFVFSQELCDCSSKMEFVFEEIENNSASFAHQVKEYKREKEYKKHKNQIKKIAKRIQIKKECIGIIQFYLSFLRDAHQKLHLDSKYYPFDSFQDTVKVKQFVKKTFTNFPLKKENNIGILGKWTYKDGSFEIEIQENKKNGRTYIGILTKPFKYYANRGDLKIEFYKNQEGKLIANYWSFGQVPTTYKVKLDNKKLKLGRNLEFHRNLDTLKTTQEDFLADFTYFKSLSGKTNYLRINSFDYEQKNLIDSILKVNHKTLITKENLIVDVRNNGGGSDLSYYPLLSYIMDSTYFKTPISASVWVSKDNFNNYDKERYLYGVETKQDSLEADNEILELKKYLGGFEPSNFWVQKIDTVYSNPKQVAIIINRWNASSTEGFVLVSKQSKKVKIYGENTGGIVSYGEWRELKIPDLPAWISMTQKRMRFYDGSDFEMIGIKPDIRLNEKEKDNWIELTRKEIEK